MSGEDVEAFMKIENYVDVEDNDPVDDDDVNVELSKAYDEHSWPDDRPTGYSYKGKKKCFIKAVESLKILMKKGSQK